MKKEVIYSLRMSKNMRDALKKAAKGESRTIASLLDKILKEYLQGEGLLSDAEAVKEQRWFTRKQYYKPAHIHLKAGAGAKAIPIVILNISLGGVLIGYPKTGEISLSAEDLQNFELCLEDQAADRQLCFNCKVDWTHESGYGVQVGAHFYDTDTSDMQVLRSYLN